MISPAFVLCQECIAKVITSVSHQIHWYSFALVILVIYIYGWFSLPLIPIVFQLSRSAEHRCSRCFNQIKLIRFYGLPHFASVIWQFKIGNVRIVAARRYFYVALIFLICFGIFCLRNLFYTSNSPIQVRTNQIITISDTWNDYLSNCGSSIIINNPLIARSRFEDSYYDRYINLNGFYGTEITNSNQDLLYTKLIGIRMDPPECNFEPDLILVVRNKDCYECIQKLKNFSKGDGINFEGRMYYLGNELDPHFVIASNISKLEIHKNITLEPSSRPLNINLNN